mgnify:FL=1
MKDRLFKNWRYPLDITTDELLQNKDYLRDRTKLFREHRNGWWWYFGSKSGKYTIHEHDVYLRGFICDYDD